MDKTGEGGREFQDALWNTFFLTVPKTFEVVSFSVLLNSGIEKVYR